MVKLRIQLNDIHESIPVKDGYYLLVVNDDPDDLEKLVPAELCGGTFFKLEGLAGEVAAGMIYMPEIYDKKDILAWGRIPDNY